MFLQTISEIGLLGSTVGLGVLSQLPDPITTGEKLGNMSASVLLGVVAVASVWGMVKIYQQKCAEEKEMRQKMYDLINSNTVQAAKATQILETMVQSNNDVRDVVMKCRKE